MVEDTTWVGRDYDGESAYVRTQCYFKFPKTTFCGSGAFAYVVRGTRELANEIRITICPVWWKTLEEQNKKGYVTMDKQKKDFRSLQDIKSKGFLKYAWLNFLDRMTPLDQGFMHEVCNINAPISRHC